MKDRKRDVFLAILISLSLILSIGLFAHVKKERSAMKKALNDLASYRMKLMRHKKTLGELARIRVKMAEGGFTGEEGGIDLEASFSVVDFNNFVKHISDIYYSGGFFFLNTFMEKTEIPQKETEEKQAPNLPMAIASIAGKKVVGYKR